MIFHISQEYLKVRNQYPSYMALFTDGSKDGNRVASAAYCRGYTESESAWSCFNLYRLK